MKVLIIGLPLFAKKLAADLNAFDGANTYVACDTYYSYFGKLKFLLHLPSTDIVHSINGTNYGSKVFELALKTNRKLMIHWVGTDVLKSTKNLENNQVNQDFVDKASHFSEPQWLKDELVQIGIKARLLTFTTLETDKDYKREKPTEFSVLSYIGNNREEFYGINNLLKLANDFPSTTFNIVGTTLKEYTVPENVNMLGWVHNIHELYQENILYIRLTEHDGLSSSILEAMSLGCHIIWTCKFPHAYHFAEYTELSEHFHTLIEQFEQGKLQGNLQGMDYISENFDKRKVLEGLVDSYKRELGESTADEG